MGKGTKYTSKKQANQSSGAAKAWKYFEKLYKEVEWIEFDYGSQQWAAKVKTVANTIYADAAYIRLHK